MGNPYVLKKLPNGDKKIIQIFKEIYELKKYVSFPDLGKKIQEKTTHFHQ